MIILPVKGFLPAPLLAFIALISAPMVVLPIFTVLNTALMHVGLIYPELSVFLFQSSRMLFGVTLISGLFAKTSFFKHLQHFVLVFCFFKKLREIFFHGFAFRISQSWQIICDRQHAGLLRLYILKCCS